MLLGFCPLLYQRMAFVIVWVCSYRLMPQCDEHKADRHPDSSFRPTTPWLQDATKHTVVPSLPVIGACLLVEKYEIQDVDAGWL